MKRVHRTRTVGLFSVINPSVVEFRIWCVGIHCLVESIERTSTLGRGAPEHDNRRTRYATSKLGNHGVGLGADRLRKLTDINAADVIDIDE